MRSALKRLLAAGLWTALGRRNLVRLARFLSMESRLDLNAGVDAHGEPVVRAAVARHAGRPFDVLDVGAHTGEWTAALLDACAEAGRDDVRVHAFEPSRATFQRLEQRFAGHPVAERLSLHRCALGSRLGSGRLHVVHELAGSNSLYPAYGAESAAAEEVPVTTVDAYLEERGIDRLALLKVDAEGHDPEVLAGAAEAIAARAIEVAQFEYNVRWVDSRAYLRDAFALFEPAGYRLGKVTRKGIELYRGWHPELESFREANFIACLPPWVERFPTLPWWHDPRRDGAH